MSGPADFPIYLDHHSTTPCDPRVLEKMLPFFSERFGNPAAVTHAQGRQASTALEEARSVVADFIRARPTEIYFTSGATEANNIAIRGVAVRQPGHVITTAIEHKSVLAPVEQLAGIEVTRLRPDPEGFVSAEQVREALRPETFLVSVIAANGEIGTIQPLQEIASVCREHGVVFHTDATQAIGRIPFDVNAIGCDLASMSAHKVYGPKGIGALYVRKGVRISPLVVGGGQERNLRSGTVNLPGVIGLAEALKYRSDEMAGEAARLTALRNLMWDRVTGEIELASVNGPRGLRLPGNLNFSFARVDSEALMMSMRRFSLSSGSACSAGEKDPSYVLRAIGVPEDLAMSSIRVGLGRMNTEEQVNQFVDDLQVSVSRLREISV
ncbi:MAG TPA: cysteine desulfurase family protein [Thermoanaerobaculia bacterium]|nr:cysteine desulfurase family protein [Thermoanaerobaculia bacterium]